MCSKETDAIWKISWPLTTSGEIVLQKCPGGAESSGMHYTPNWFVLNNFFVFYTCSLFILGLASRLCDGNPAVWQDPNVENCFTVEIIKIKEEVINLNATYYASRISENSDRTIIVEPDILQSITGELANITDRNTVILPNDLEDAINTIETILR